MYGLDVRAIILVFAAALLELVPRPAAAQPLDPGCGNRAAIGRFNCTIVQPNVRQRETLYPSVVFAPGDVVRVAASGCVQTGGAGQTWKRYVDPSGPNADRLYHGLIRIPGATTGQGLVRIKDTVGRNLTVQSTGLPLSEYILHLGYEDDDYGNNGYNDHDDGTGNQCRNIGPAQVSLVIVRTGNAGPPPVASNFDFNLEWQTVAPGGLPLNPHWTWQNNHRGEIPPTSLCHNFSKEVRQTGPNGTTVVVRVPDFADCTNQTDLNHVDTGDGFNGFICGFSDTDAFHGHVNWFAVTLDGTLTWGDHNVDDDYTLGARVPDNAGSVNGRHDIHTEFDSDETIDHFGTGWWRDFRAAVDASQSAKATLAACAGGGAGLTCTPEALATLRRAADAPKAIFSATTRAIVTGMFGLDCEHNCKVELHPVYAVAAKVQDAAQDEVWAMFVRNVGNEGYCSRNLWEAPFTTYTFRLPWRAGMQSVQVVWGVGKSEFEGTPGTSGPDVSFIPIVGGGPAGVYVTFKLPLPSASPLIDGVLHLRWQGPANETARAGPPVIGNEPPRLSEAAAPAPAEQDNDEADEAEGRVAAAIAGLTPAQRTDVSRALEGARHSISLRALPSGAVARQVPSTAVSVRSAAVLLGRKGPIATRKRERDTALATALCAASANAPSGLPADACKSLPPARPR